jgi:hypothetical protein
MQGMELLQLTGAPAPLLPPGPGSLLPPGAPGPLPLLPPAAAAQGIGKPTLLQNALKTSSLSRMEELQSYLHRCDDPAYLQNYVKVLSAVPRDVLDDLAKRIKARSAWLSSEEQREYKRAKLLNVMGGALASPPRTSPPVLPPGSATLAPSPLRIFNTHSLAAAGGAVAAPEADAFCSDVLGGGGGGSGGMQLERLEMDPFLAGLPPFLTPADARRGKAAPLAAAQLGGGGGAIAAGTGDDSPPGAPGITEHRISPDAAQPSAGTQGALVLTHEAVGSGRVRQATLLPATK